MAKQTLADLKRRITDLEFDLTTAQSETRAYREFASEIFKGALKNLEGNTYTPPSFFIKRVQQLWVGKLTPHIYWGDK